MNNLDGFEICILINACLWAICFIYRITCYVIKKIKRIPTEATIGRVCLWVVFAILTSIFGPVTLVPVVIFALSWALGEGIPYLWDHGLESTCEWLDDHIFSKSL